MFEKVKNSKQKQNSPLKMCTKLCFFKIYSNLQLIQVHFFRKVLQVYSTYDWLFLEVELFDAVLFPAIIRPTLSTIISTVNDDKLLQI